MIFPPALKPGSKVAVTASSSTVSGKSLAEGIKILESWGLEIVLGNTLGTRYHNFSAKDHDRLQELQRFLNDESIEAIIFARGGYGITRILDQLNFDKFLEKPKHLVGFSDLSALHLHLNTLNISSVHGPMVKTMSFDASSNQTLHDALFHPQKKINYTFRPQKINRPGLVSGMAIGGNLCMICHCLGSPSEPDFNHKILFIEDIGEYSYAIDRYLVQLKRAGVFKKIAALVLGDFSDLKENAIPFGKNIEQMVLEHSQEYHLPTAFGFSFGHEKVNYTICMGKTYRLDIQTKIAILES